MDQKDGIVHGNSQLQNCRHAVRQKRNLPQKNIRPLIDDNGNPHDGEIEHRLKPGIGGYAQDHEDHDHSQRQDHGHLSRYILLQGLVLNSHSSEVSLVPQDFLHLIDGPGRPLVRIPLHEGHVHDGRAVLVVVGNVVSVDKTVR